MTGPDPAERLAALLNGGASSPNPTSAAPVSPQRDPGHPTPATGDTGADRSPSPSTGATSTLAASSRPEIGPGDIVVAVLAGRPNLCAVQRIRRADHTAIVRPLDQLDHYDRVPAQDLRRVAAHDAIIRWAGL